MTISNNDQTKYLPLRDFCNRYNDGQPESMQLDPSYLQFLCDQKTIEHVVIPSRDGRKKDIYKIPEYELEKVAVLMDNEKAQGKLLSAKEVSSLLGVDLSYVSVLGGRGDIIRKKIFKPNTRGPKNRYGYEEESVLSYMERKESRKKKKNSEEKPADHGRFSWKSGEADIEKLMAVIDDLVEKNRELEKQLNDKSVKTEDENIFEAYKRGFIDGFEMGIKKER